MKKSNKKPYLVVLVSLACSLMVVFGLACVGTFADDVIGGIEFTTTGALPTFEGQEIVFANADFNQDGLTNCEDAALLYNNIKDAAKYPIDSSLNRDVNGDGKVDNTDVRYVVMYTYYPDNYQIFPVPSKK